VNITFEQAREVLTETGFTLGSLAISFYGFANEKPVPGMLALSCCVALGTDLVNRFVLNQPEIESQPETKQPTTA